MSTANPTRQDLLQEVRFLKSVGMSRAPLLGRLGIYRAMDLLFFFPRAYEAPAPIQGVELFTNGTQVTFVGTVQELDERVTQNGKHMLGVQIAADGGGFVRLLWFNQPFRKDSLKPGTRITATGLPRSTVLNWEMVQPQIRLLEADEVPEGRRPLAIYPLTEGLKAAGMRFIMQESLPDLIPLIEEVLPTELRERLGVLDIASALHAIHFPDSLAEAEQGQARFKAQELLVLQLALSLQRAAREGSAKAPVCEPSGKIHSRILNRLPFQLTQDQATSVAEIGRDMARDIPMNRLLQGDVGSGKTVVAQYAMLLCVAHGCQATLMAPTEVLARQHAGTLDRSLASSRVRVALLTGSLSTRQRRETIERVASGEVDLLVGTQAILSDEVVFHQLGLVIVDEQHKFGVMQRAKLRTDASQPHYLVLSATPIPRTIAMTAFGDLDVSTIRSKPPGRAPVHTYVAPKDSLDSWWRFVEEQLKQGRQAYVIAPRVAEVDPESDVASAEGFYEHLRKQVFGHRAVGLLHGRMDGADKESVLEQFASGDLDILVATTVVEVGIDVPNATVMTILDANRLGLSQLHQLRGRVSRGTHAGFVCAVPTSGCEPQDNARLQAFEQSDDGFELAEMDLRLRGPGDLLGTSQSGLPPLRIANLVDDAQWVALAQEVAREILQQDPNMESPAFAKLKQQTLRRYGESMQLGDVG
ncbi:ATP-dependent DNA helicase RecG [Aureliella helgolandensis]|uniref:ATP-dependent DNA helicase RecG n=1 Tax=Aureliella helgolandensis TaxID=2527968 RepID=A0A518FZU5_9BACT|nr:ATP-dependent DNA helicase RecG [Aureliella helgolandensis]QDV21879.1 ATP-dependent DNA helicase RecG [Aureliella helgolandensis]